MLRVSVYACAFRGAFFDQMSSNMLQLADDVPGAWQLINRDRDRVSHGVCAELTNHGLCTHAMNKSSSFVLLLNACLMQGVASPSMARCPQELWISG